MSFQSDGTITQISTDLDLGGRCSLFDTFHSDSIVILTGDLKNGFKIIMLGLYTEPLYQVELYGAKG